MNIAASHKIATGKAFRMKMSADEFRKQPTSLVEPSSPVAILQRFSLFRVRQNTGSLSEFGTQGHCFAWYVFWFVFSESSSRRMIWSFSKSEPEVRVGVVESSCRERNFRLVVLSRVRVRVRDGGSEIWVNLSRLESHFTSTEFGLNSQWST